MAERYYCPQWCHSTRGWLDLPSLASYSKKVANDLSKQFAEENHVVARVIRKPHGWKPEPSIVDTIPEVITDHYDPPNNYGGKRQDGYYSD